MSSKNNSNLEEAQLPAGGKSEVEKTAEVAKLLLRQNLKNLAQKVKEGVGLSKFETEQLKELANSGAPNSGAEWVKNQVELAAALGVDRKTIARWRKESGFPAPASDGRWNVPAVRNWMAANGKRQNSAEGEESFDRETLEIRRLKMVCDRLEYDFAIARGDYLSKESVEEQVARMVSAFRREITALPAMLAPQVVGLEVAPAERLLREQINKSLEHLHSGEWPEVEENA